MQIHWKGVGPALGARLGNGNGNGHAHHEPEHVAPADVIETRDAVIVEVELPGMSLADMRIELENDVLTITAERKLAAPAGRTHHHSERHHGRFVRSFMLPATVDGASARASYAAGVVMIELPKRPEARPRTIPISGGDES